MVKRTGKGQIAVKKKKVLFVLNAQQGGGFLVISQSSWRNQPSDGEYFTEKITENAIPSTQHRPWTWMLFLRHFLGFMQCQVKHLMDWGNWEPYRHSLWPAASKTNQCSSPKIIMVCLQWDLPPLQLGFFWRFELLCPGLPGCSHLQFQSLLYSWIKNTGKITEAVHKKKKWSHLCVTPQSLGPALPSFHIVYPRWLLSLHGTQEHCDSSSSLVSKYHPGDISPVICCCWNISALLHNCLCSQDCDILWFSFCRKVVTTFIPFSNWILYWLEVQADCLVIPYEKVPYKIFNFLLHPIYVVFSYHCIEPNT